jgi:hypothetical protein
MFPSSIPRRVSLRWFCFLLTLLASGSLYAQNVRLTEFMADNATGIKDEDGTAQPWIEIWNPNQAAKAVLTGSKIDNGTVKWTFPAFEMMPDERVIIWASGKNRIVPTAPLHTSFTLPKTGGSVILRRSDDSIMSRINYSAQTTDISYGRDEWDAATTAVLTGIYENPTPGERNNFSGAGVAGNVVVSPTSKAFTGSVSVTLSLVNPDPDTVIRYTTNGVSPTAASTQYTAPFTVSTTQIVRARSYKPGVLPGETETEGYLLLDATTTNFTSSMQLCVISNFQGGLPPDSGDQPGFLWAWAPGAPDNRTHFADAPVLAGRVVMDRRGSSTLGNPKYNLNIEFRKARDDDDRDVSVAGMPLGSDWVFGAPYDFDRALIRNPLAYALSNAIGRYATRTREAEVFIDINGGALGFTGVASGDYFGVYNLTEKIRRDDDRVDIEKLGAYDNDAVGKTGGYIYKIDRRDTGDFGFAAGGYPIGDGTNAFPGGTCYYYPNESDIKMPQRDPQRLFLTASVNEMVGALNGATWNNPVTGYAKYIDVPEAVDHHLVNVWTNNLDAFRLSGYWHMRRGGKHIPGPVWDFDRSIDCSSDARDDNPVVWRGGGDGTDFFNYTWWNRLFLDIDFYQKLIDRWQELRRGLYSQTTINALIDQLNAEISAEAVARDLSRWNMAKRAWVSPFTGTSYSGQTAEIQRIKDYLQRRANFMDTQWVAPVTASVPEGQVTPGTQVTLTGPASSVVYYTLNGADPRPAGGGATPGAGVLTYSTPITISATTRLRSRAYKATQTAVTGANNPPLVSKWSGLTNNLYTTDTPAAAGNLIITEIDYHPANPTPAELAVNAFWGDNDFEFVELRNLSEGTINLAGCQFNLGITFSFTGDNAISIPGGGYVVLAANPDAFKARHGTSATVLGPFTGSLSNGGEKLRLATANDTLIQEVTYEDSWFSSTDGGGRTLVVYNPKAADPGAAANWRASAAANGSPGAGEPNLPPDIVIAPQLSGDFTSVPLPAEVTDDGQPDPNTVSVSWSKLSGPGTVQFSPPDAAYSMATFSMPGAYTLRLVAGDNVLTSQADVAVTAHDTYVAWQARHPGIGTATDDFDHDGLTNLAEFALLTDPEHVDAASAFSSTRTGTAITVTYRRQTGQTNPAIEVQSSAGLGTFQTLAAAEFTESILSDDGVVQTVKVTIPDAAGVNRRFIRLQITGP